MGDNTVNFCGTAGGVMNNGVALPVNMVDMTNLWRRDFNDAILYYATIVGGQKNTVHKEFGTVVGGYNNYAAAESTTVVGGFKNKAYSNYATVIGGFMNQASGRFATVLGGSRNYARGRFSFAAGFMADATKDNSAAFGFTSDGSTCATRSEEQVAVCADVITINGHDVFGMMNEYKRKLVVDSVESNAKEMSELKSILDSQEKRMAAQDKLLHELSLALEGFSAQLDK